MPEKNIEHKIQAAQQPCPFFENQFCIINGTAERVQIVSIDGANAKVAFNDKGDVRHKNIPWRELQNVHPARTIRETGETVYIVQTERHPDWDSERDDDKNFAIVQQPLFAADGTFTGYARKRIQFGKLAGRA